MTREELREKRNQTIESLNYIKATLGLDELYIDELEKENVQLEKKLEALEGQTPWTDIKDKSEVIGKLTKAKEIMNIAIEGIKYWGIVGGNERPLEKQAEMLFNLFLDKAEQFLKEIEK